MSLWKAFKYAVVEPFAEPLGIALTFAAFLLGVLYGGGDVAHAAISVGVWLAVLYIAAVAAKKLL